MICVTIGYTLMDSVLVVIAAFQGDDALSTNFGDVGNELGGVANALVQSYTVGA